MEFIKKTINLQLFGAGEAVHSTEGFVNTKDASKNEAYVETPGKESGLSAEMKTFYDKTLIELAGPSLVYDQFAQKRPIPAGGGKSIEFRKFNALPKALTPITEGVTPTASKLTVVPVTATVDQYGDYVELTDMIELTSVDPIVVEATKQLADQAGRTIDTVVRNQIMGGTNVNYCPLVGSDGTETEITSRKNITPECVLRVKDVFRAAAQLKAMNAPTIDGSYVAVIHPYVAFDLMQDAKGQWLDIQKYADPQNILKGEIGTLGGVRFVQSSEAKIYTGDEGGKDGAAVFCTLFIGANAYGSTDIAGGGIEHIVKQKGYGNDPLNQRSSVGWKATKVATRLVEEYMVRVESGSSFSSSVIEAN
ncbi:MAG: N4-gp56 family major capsid protein [Clostridia bacterium]|nr:N4-gp56 family major capsid protein [Clostridia bacterium]